MQLVIFQVHLMLHACVRRFYVMGTVEKILGTKHPLSLSETLEAKEPNIRDFLGLKNEKALLRSFLVLLAYMRPTILLLPSVPTSWMHAY